MVLLSDILRSTLLIVLDLHGGGERKNYRICRNFYIKFVDIFRKMRIMSTCMDTHNDVSMAIGKLTAEIGCRKVVVGAKQLRKALGAGKVFRVYLAENADPAITEPFVALCQQNNVEFAWVRSMTDLGRACGIEVGAAAAAILL